ncbi:MAG: hypothetical protein ACK4IY_03915, partial [Chitinophagales bacterium]
MKNVLFVLAIVTMAISCKQKEAVPSMADIQTLAAQYVHLGLTIGQYDENFVDAYYGPDSLKPTSEKNAVFPKDSLLNEVQRLQQALQTLMETTEDDTIAVRAKW